MSYFEAMFGDDFPDAFTHRDGRSCRSKKTLLDLPSEMLAAVCQTLSNVDIKQLRLTCRGLADNVELRIDRVFISPNRANLECLNNILDHPRYRLRVREIVWDDAQLAEYPTLELFCNRMTWDGTYAYSALEYHLRKLRQPDHSSDSESDILGPEGLIHWNGLLTELGKAFLLDAKDDRSMAFVARDFTNLQIEKSLMEESYLLYQKLYQDEREIIKRGWDTKGLQRAMTELPNLKRITLTGKIWYSWDPIPTYDTPFFRALPAGFRKPSVSPWRETCTNEETAILENRLPAAWRGYSIVMSLLAACPVPDLQEFVMETGDEDIGLPALFGQDSNIDYINTLQVLSTLRLRRLQLPFIDRFGYPVVKASHFLENIVSAAQYLEELDLRFHSNFGDIEDFLDAGLLGQQCSNLKHLVLREANVNIDWLFRLVTQVKTLESCVLDHLDRNDNAMTASGLRNDVKFDGACILFSRLKDYYASLSVRGPSFTWIQEIYKTDVIYFGNQPYPPSFPVLDGKLNAFLYEGGEMPFNTREESEQQNGEIYKPGFGRPVEGEQ